jgi:WD40 repeat protein
MRFQTCLIVWHGKEPVFSLDFHPSGRLATGGADNTVKVVLLFVNIQDTFFSKSKPQTPFSNNRSGD